MAMTRNRHVNGASTVAESEEAEIKKNKPNGSRLRQQLLPAWQPILNAKAVIPVFFSISLLFVPLGIILLITSNGVKEWTGYYDEMCNGNFGPGTNKCNITIDLDENFQGDVYFYYGLENYYQNHRRYMKSRNDMQMLGHLDKVSDCGPFDKIGNQMIAPCGAIANSMFNDTFTLLDNSRKKIEWSYHELIWPVDKEKFRNPKCNNGTRVCANSLELCGAFEEYAKPLNWGTEPCKLDTEDVNNSGLQNADFIIWMRTAAFPDFRKPYRKLKDSSYPNGLTRGRYFLNIVYNYNVSSFSGRKSFIISTTSWLGGKNPFLGYAYIAVGILCAVLGVVYIFVHVKYGHSMQEMAGIEQATRATPLS